jgi:hypothetical protein
VNGDEPLSFLTYPFTHHRVHLSVYRAPAPPQLAPNEQWFLSAELADIALTAPHRRAIEHLMKNLAA